MISRWTPRVLLLDVVFLFLTGCEHTGLEHVLKEYGYSELRPPSTLAPPGTIVHVKSKTPYEVSVICPPMEAFGPNFSPVPSDTKQTVLSSSTSKTFELDAGYLDLLKADSRYKDLKSIKVLLSNVKVPIITDEMVVKNVSNRSLTCAEAVKNRRSQKFDLTVVDSVLIADVVYSIEFDSKLNLSVEVKKGLIQGLSPKLGADSSTVTAESVNGKSLYWGISENAYLLSIEPSTLVKLQSGETKVAEDLNSSDPLVPLNIKVRPLISSGSGVSLDKRCQPPGYHSPESCYYKLTITKILDKAKGLVLGRIPRQEVEQNAIGCRAVNGQSHQQCPDPNTYPYRDFQFIIAGGATTVEEQATYEFESDPKTDKLHIKGTSAIKTSALH